MATNHCLWWRISSDCHWIQAQPPSPIDPMTLGMRHDVILRSWSKCNYVLNAFDPMTLGMRWLETWHHHKILQHETAASSGTDYNNISDGHVMTSVTCDLMTWVTGHLKTSATGHNLLTYLHSMTPLPSMIGRQQSIHWTNTLLNRHVLALRGLSLSKCD